jgi:hypothetical protein
VHAIAEEIIQLADAKTQLAEISAAMDDIQDRRKNNRHPALSIYSILTD